MTSKVENYFSEAHFDTILCFSSYGQAIWQSHMALPYGKTIWLGHMMKNMELCQNGLQKNDS